MTINNLKLTDKKEKSTNLNQNNITAKELLETLEEFDKEEFLEYLVKSNFIGEGKYKKLLDSHTDIDHVIMEIYLESKAGNLTKEFQKLLNNYILIYGNNYEKQTLLLLGFPEDTINDSLIRVLKPIILIQKYHLLKQGNDLKIILEETSYNIGRTKAIVKQLIKNVKETINGLNAPKKDKKILKEFLLN